VLTREAGKVCPPLRTGVSPAHNPQSTIQRGLDWRPRGRLLPPRGRPKDYARALTACSMRSIPFSMFFMDMA